MKQKITKQLESIINGKTILGTALRIERSSGEVIFDGATGNLKTSSQYFIASTTKLYTTAMMMKLRSEKKLNLDDKISKYIDEKSLLNLNRYNGVDHSKEISIRHLITQTSGIPDYFSDKNLNGKSIEAELRNGNDRKWTFEDSLEIAKAMKTSFAPGQKGKAHYCDTNFQLLGKIIENIREDSIENIFEKEIFTPLQLTKTYMYTGATDQKPVEMYNKDKILLIPLAMASTRADGGIVSTTEESMKFIRGFFMGKFFPKEYIDEMRTNYHGVMFPLQYGMGIMRFKLPLLMTLFHEIPELIGHSGLSGAFDYYCPSKDIYMTGTVNQVSDPSISYKLLATITDSL
jgi:CubicO group peptidase (beta-lactamase class C family)